MSPQDPNGSGLLITSKMISTIVGVIAIMTSLYYFFERVNSYELRLARVEIIDLQRSTEIQTLTSELKQLNVKLTDLTVELKEISAIQKHKDSK
jgi:hypothetical protein